MTSLPKWTEVVMAELWIVLVVAAAVVFVVLAMRALSEGDWWWN